MDREEDEQARRLHEEGLGYELYQLIEPYLQQRDPSALRYWSTIVLPEWDETIAESDERRIRLLTEASDAGEPLALYQLACCYMFGDSTDVNRPKAIELARKAVDAGVDKAKTLIWP